MPILIALGYDVLEARRWARLTAVVLEAVSAIVNFVFLPAYPLWSVIAITLDLLVDRREQCGLVVELVIQRAPRHPGPADDRLGGDVGKPLVGEQLPRGIDQQRPRRGGALGLCAPGRGDHIFIDFHTGCT